MMRGPLQRLVDTISDHDDALSRLDAGTYGACTVCGRPIPIERLEAIPDVNHCVECARLASRPIRLVST